MSAMYVIFCFFFFNDTATTEIYTLSLHDALPIYVLDDEPRLLQPPRERAGQVGMDDVFLPRREHAGRARAIARVPDDGVPVGVEHEQAAARTEHAAGFSERAREIADVLVDLRRHRGVEGRLGKGQGHGVGFTELHPREPGATGPPHRQHLVAQIDAHDATGWAEGPRHPLGGEAGAGAP